MRLALAAFLLCSGCVIKERVRVERIEVPPKVIEKIYLIPTLPASPDEKEDEAPKMLA